MKIVFVFPTDPTGVFGHRLFVDELKNWLPPLVSRLAPTGFNEAFCCHDGASDMVRLCRKLGIDNWRVLGVLNGTSTPTNGEHDHKHAAIAAINTLHSTVYPTCKCGGGHCCPKMAEQKTILVMAHPEIIYAVYGMMIGHSRDRVIKSSEVWAKDHFVVVDYDGKHLSQG